MMRRGGVYMEISCSYLHGYVRGSRKRDGVLPSRFLHLAQALFTTWLVFALDFVVRDALIGSSLRCFSYRKVRIS